METMRKRASSVVEIREQKSLKRRLSGKLDVYRGYPAKRQAGDIVVDGGGTSP